MNEPTCEELWHADMGETDDYVKVDSQADPSWRHGCYMADVFQRPSDSTFWLVTYRLSGDGETNELREGYGTIKQVYPKQKTVTYYSVEP